MPAFQFDASQHRPEYGGGGFLPVGKHPVMIVETELKPTKDTHGGYLALTMEAVDGPAKGTKHTDRLNLHNANAMTVEIANKQLSAYCYVTGVFKFSDTNELCRRPFVVEIAPQKNRPELTEVVAVYTSDMRKPAEVLQSGNAPAQSAAIPPAQTAAPSQVIAAQTDALGPSVSPSNDAWGNANAAPSPAASAWTAGNANPSAPPPWGNPAS